MNNKRSVLLVLTAEVALSIALKIFGGSLSDLSYRALDTLFGAIAIGLMLFLTAWRVPLKSKMKSVPSIFFVFGAFMATIILANLWADFLRSQSLMYRSPGAIGNVTPSEAAAGVSIIFSVIIAPIKEEMLFRLGWLGNLSGFMRKAFALSISTTVFTLSHLGGGFSYTVLVPIAVAGLFLGVTYLALGLPWAIMLHVLMNLQPLLKEKGINQMIDGDMGFIVLLVLTASGLWVFISRLFRMRGRIFGST